MSFKMRKRLKRAFLLVCVGMLVVCSMAFSVSADEVIFNGTLTFDDDMYGYVFPSYISLTVGDTYSLTYNGVTDTGQVNAPSEDLPAYYIAFYNIGLMLVSGDIGNGNQTGIIWQADGEPPSTIDVILSKASSTDQSQDQVIFEQDVAFSNYGGSMLGTLENVSLNFIVGREYEISVNGIKRVYTAQAFEDGAGVYIGVAPVQDGDFLVGNFGNGFVINADSLVTAGTYPVKITLLGIPDPFFGTVTEILTASIGWVKQVVSMFIQTPLFLVGLLVFFVIGGSVLALKRSF